MSGLGRKPGFTGLDKVLGKAGEERLRGRFFPKREEMGISHRPNLFLSSDQLSCCSVLRLGNKPWAEFCDWLLTGDPRSMSVIAMLQQALDLHALGSMPSVTRLVGCFEPVVRAEAFLSQAAQKTEPSPKFILKIVPQKPHPELPP